MRPPAPRGCRLTAAWLFALLAAAPPTLAHADHAPPPAVAPGPAAAEPPLTGASPSPQPPSAPLLPLLLPALLTVAWGASRARRWRRRSPQPCRQVPASPTWGALGFLALYLATSPPHLVHHLSESDPQRSECLVASSAERTQGIAAEVVILTAAEDISLAARPPDPAVPLTIPLIPSDARAPPPVAA